MKSIRRLCCSHLLSFLFFLVLACLAPLTTLRAQLSYPAPYTFTTLAGSAGNPGANNDTGTAATFSTPTSVAVDAAGNVYVADFNNNAIRKITPAGVVTVYAGNPGSAGNFDAPSGPATSARFVFPAGVAVDAAGNVYVADFGANNIRMITPGGAVTTVAGVPEGGGGGGPSPQGSADNADPLLAEFNTPSGVAVDGAGNLYVADYGNEIIRKIAVGGGVTTLAGAPGATGTTDDTGPDARFNGPTGVAVDGSGNVYVADYFNSTIRKITSGGVVTTLAGLGANTGAKDDTGSVARFNGPLGVAVDAFGSVYVADRDNNVIRRVTAAGVATTLAGDSGSAPGAGDNTGSLASFNGPRGLAVDSSGNVYVADTSNHTIRKSSPSAAPTISSGASVAFSSSYTATATGGDSTGALVWSLGAGSTATGAAINASTGAVSFTSVGDVIFNVRRAADGIYPASASTSDFTLTVTKGTQSAVSITSSGSGTYGVPYTATATGGNGSGALVWALGVGSTASGAAIDDTTGAVTFTSPGTVVFNVYRAGDSNYNDSATTSDFTLTVAKASQAALSVSSSASGTFGSAYTATAAGGSGTGALSWSLGTGSTAPDAAIDATTGAVTSTGTGTVVIKVTKAADVNYLAATSADFTVTMAKAAQAAVSITSSASGTYGVAYTATATGGSGTGGLVWALGTGSTASGAAIDSSTGEVTFTSAGTVVFHVHRAGDADYNDSATSNDFTLTVNKAAQATVSVNSSASGTFGSSYTATATGGSGVGALSWSLGTGSTAPGAAIDATTGAVTSTGAGTVVIKVTKATDTNYLAATSADFTVTLAKAAQAAVSINSSASGTYGNAYTATATGGSGTGAIVWALGAGSTAGGAAIDSSTGAVTFTSAGTVVFNAYRAGDADYNDSATTSDFTLTVAKASQATLSVSSSASGTFGSSYTATATGGSGAGALTWSLGTGSTAASAAIDATTGAVTSAGAGTVVIKVTKATDTNYLVATSADFTVTLAKAAQATLSVNSSASGTFGSSYTATATGGSGAGALSWSLGTGSTAASAAIDATTGAVTSAGAGTVVIKVTKATDTDYLAATSADFTVTLAKATQATLSVSSSASGTFASSYTATATGGSGTGVLSWALGTGSTAASAAIDATTGAVTSAGAGTVVINVTKATDTNYLATTSADFTITLAKAAQAPVSITSSTAGTYGAAYTATASGGTGTGALVWTLGSGSTASGAAINSSTGIVTFTSPGAVVFNVYRASDANYNASATTSDFTLTVTKAAQATLSVSSSASGTFGSSYTATATGGSGTGALSWALGTGSTAAGAAIDATTGAVTSTGAGTVVIKVTKATDTNYLAATSADFTVTLAKATQAALSVSSSASGTFASPYTATATGGSGTGTLSWALGTGSTAPGAAIDATTGAVTSSGTGTVVIKVTKATDTDYLAAISADFTVTLAKATQSSLNVSSSASGTFGSAYTATATGGSGTGALSWALGTGSTAPSAAIDATTGAITSAGAGTVVIKVTKATDTNYLAATSADFTVTLAKATQATLSVSSSASGTFGSSYTATAAGGSGTGAVTWALGTGSTAPGAAIDATNGAVTSTGAGTVVINATKAADTNYLAVTSTDFTITLAKAAATVTLGSLTATYDGNPHAASATTAPSGKTVTFTYDGSTTAPTNAGTYAVVATISDTNYQGSASGSLVIAQAVAVITWPAPSAISQGTALSSTQLNASANTAGTFAYNPATGTVLDTGSHTLTATFTPTDTTNYSGASAQQSLVVNLASGAPLFLTHPVSQTIAIDYPVTFTALASGSTTPTYQWRKNGVNIVGATNSTYTISIVTAGDAGDYTVVATNASGSATSNTATLTPYVAAPSDATIQFTVE